MGWRAWGCGSVDVALVAALGGEAGEIGFGSGGLHAALLGEDVEEAAIDIARHPLRVAADVEMRALFEPRPEERGAFEEAVLDVDLVLLVARKGGVEAGQEAALVPLMEFVFEKEVARAVRVAEDEP